jgi:two-component system nitrogen regulation sensor histidine kinase NtrY
MKNLRILLTLFLISVIAIVITGIVLNYLGIEHGPLLIRIGAIFIIVNIILYLLLLIFFVTKNLIHLYLEKRKKTIGSRFRTRLVVSFVSLTLIPSTLLFILSIQLIKNSIDTWFSIEIREPIYDSMDVARYFYASERTDAEHLAEFVASNIKKPSFRHTDKTFKISMLKRDNGMEIVKEAFSGKTSSEILTTEEGDIIRAAAPVIDAGRIEGVILVQKTIPKDVVEQMESVRRSYNEYNQIRIQQRPIRFIYFLMLTIATLLIIFLALWISLRIAKGITVPIRSLVEATNAVAHGNLNFKIDYTRDDEIGLLINSFNKMVNDLNESKRSLERAYKESDRRRLTMEAILESINSGVIFLDRTGKIVTTNNAACSMLDIRRDDLIGKGHKELIESLKSEELSSMVKRLAEKGKGSIERDIHIYINGRPMDLRVYITTLNDSSNNFIGTLVIFDNLTEIIAAQRALAWQEVAKRMAHEIKNPLTPIKLSAERLLKKWNEKAEDFDMTLRRSVNTIVKEANSLKSLVDEFSRFGKMPRINLAPSSIKQIVDEVVELYSDIRDVKIYTSVEDMEIEVDREQIKRALINLIDNAIQAKTETIWINSYYDPELDIVRIEVKDEGIGINEEDKEKLFFPYFSTKKGGMGLGLAIVSNIIAKHRGYIRVQDNKPKGTQFIIELPVGHK